MAAFAEVVRALVIILDRGQVDGPRYRQALQEYGKQFGAVRTDGRRRRGGPATTGG